MSGWHGSPGGVLPHEHAWIPEVVATFDVALRRFEIGLLDEARDAAEPKALDVGQLPTQLDVAVAGGGEARREPRRNQVLAVGGGCQRRSQRASELVIIVDERVGVDRTPR